MDTTDVDNTKQNDPIKCTLKVENSYDLFENFFKYVLIGSSCM